VIGTLNRHPDLHGANITSRHVDVWCPPGYAEQPLRRYPVVYLHDGQNLFSGAHLSGGVGWEIDAAITRLIAAGAHRGAIVVGIWNGPQRWRDYMPQVVLPAATAIGFEQYAGGPAHADAYLRFVTATVKPLIDRTYRTLPERAQTSVMGASMGGLIALYALVRYPLVFGGAGCLSTHWPAGGEPLVDALAELLPPPGQHRLYFDYGSRGLDAAYAPLQRRMDTYLVRAGYTAGHDWLTHSVPGADHNEAAWRARVELPLRFLLRTDVPAGPNSAHAEGQNG
jgi:predicted alpha/beta superfamily hydrolase